MFLPFPVNTLPRRIGSKVGPLVAPFAFTIGRLFRSRASLRLATRLDNDYVRAWQGIAVEKIYPPLSPRLCLAQKYIAETDGGFSDYFLEFIAESKSQALQDIVVAYLLHRKMEGYFVEVGVGDGIFLSNTWLFEKKLGWQGLLIEPNQAFGEKISINRTAKLDRRAAYSVDGKEFEFLDVVEFRELSTLVCQDGRDAFSREGNVYRVSSVTLNTALSEARAPTIIDFMSIDTEGSELEVVKGLDLGRWQIAVFVIEHNHDEGRRKQLGMLLAKHGYRRIFERIDLIDDWYVRPDLVTMGTVEVTQ